ncbi:MAG: hypothetical protein H7239_13495, partial [Flavobacterium sp.]|nr:hypothetical protein [Flavobacterium sp.]
MYAFLSTEQNNWNYDANRSYSDFKKWPRITELAWIIYSESGIELSRGYYIIKPDGWKIPKSISYYTGISNGKAANEGYYMKEVLNELVLKLRSVIYIVDYVDAKFDKDFISSELLRYGFANKIYMKRKISIQDNCESVFPKTDLISTMNPVDALNSKLFCEPFIFENSTLKNLCGDAKFFFY